MPHTVNGTQILIVHTTVYMNGPYVQTGGTSSTVTVVRIYTDTHRNSFGSDIIDERIAYIATKCDLKLINPKELVQNLGLESDPEYERISARLSEIDTEIRACE